MAEVWRQRLHDKHSLKSPSPSQPSFPQNAFTPGEIEPPLSGKEEIKRDSVGLTSGVRNRSFPPEPCGHDRSDFGKALVLDLVSPKWGPIWGRSFPSRGGSISPFVNAFGGKDLFEEFWKGISRKIFIGALPRAPPKGPAPWGPHVGASDSPVTDVPLLNKLLNLHAYRKIKKAPCKQTVRLVKGQAEGMKNRYLLEVGTEELPVEFMKSSQSELGEKLKTLLSEQGLNFEQLQTYVTPRRLTLLIDGLPDMQEARTHKVKGPPTRVALTPDGTPSQAGLGFARKMGVDFAALKEEALDGETYLVLEQTIEGRPTREVLAEQLPDAILGLSGSHFMHWGTSSIKFSRPIRWLVSLWNKDPLPVSIGEVHSSNASMGHRVLGNNPVLIPSVDDYATQLETQGAVVVDQERRRDVIWKQLQDEAERLGGRVSENPELLNTVTFLVEHPSVVSGSFDERFLDIPKEVITTVMAAHQKYFPVERKDSDDLLPYFLAVSNGAKDAAESIRLGNERVLTARLEDARFFFDDDRKTSLASRVESLKGITFQKGLGTLFDKTERLMRVSEQLALDLGYNEAQTQKAIQGARLAKTDLLTGMVRELTELQGEMGRKYALLEGEDPDVAASIFEQYLPRFTGDAVPTNSIGIVVSLADKLDTMVAVFSQKNARLPSGSKDPLGLRRMAAGLIQTILENNLRIPVAHRIEQAFDNLGSLATTDKAQAMEMVTNFILQRLKATLLEQNIRYDIIEAVLEARNPLDDLVDVRERIHILKDLTAQPEVIKKLYEPANRISRILGDAYRPDIAPGDIQAQCFQDPSEEALFKAMQPLETASSYPALVQVLESTAPAIDTFFEKVLINDPDATIKQNRYNVLSLLNRSYLRLARFSKLVL